MRYYCDSPQRIVKKWEILGKKKNLGREINVKRARN
jgi:hypothetical protein